MGSEDFSEFDLLPTDAHVRHEDVPLAAEPPDISALKRVLTAHDDVPFEGRYKGFEILPRNQIPQSLPAVHASLSDRFYVASPLGAVGLVPWMGSKIIWPWEAGWVQDMYRPEVQGILKETKERKK
jgi:hypothetical protein